MYPQKCTFAIFKIDPKPFIHNAVLKNTRQGFNY